MRVFSFIKNIGIKVFGIGNMNPLEVSQAAVIEMRLEEIAAIKLEEIIFDLKLKVKGLSISIDDCVAIVKGIAHNQETKEKIILIIGNCSGISKVKDKMSVEHEETESSFYTVENKDSLGKIAKLFYNNPKLYYKIFEANKPMLSHPNNIYPGLVLRVPCL
ncbi:peptidoglycan-binding protein LysM [Seonamhaeicola sp. MEBiC1930]